MYGSRFWSPEGAFEIKKREKEVTRSKENMKDGGRDQCRSKRQDNGGRDGTRDQSEEKRQPHFQL